MDARRAYEMLLESLGGLDTRPTTLSYLKEVLEKLERDSRSRGWQEAQQFQSEQENLPKF